MVTPEMPGGGSVGQPVLDDEAHGQGDDPMRVATTDRSEVGHVGVEVEPTALAAVLGVHQMDVTRPAAWEAADVVKDALPEVVAIAAAPAARAGPSAVVAGAPLDERRREIVDPSNPLSEIRDIIPRSHVRPSDSRVGLPESPTKRATSVKISRFLCYSLGKTLVLCAAISKLLFRLGRLGLRRVPFPVDRQG